MLLCKSSQNNESSNLFVRRTRKFKTITDSKHDYPVALMLNQGLVYIEIIKYGG